MDSGVFDVRETPTRTMSASSSPRPTPSSYFTANSIASIRLKYVESSGARAPGSMRAATPGDARDRVDRVPEQVAVVDACAAAQLAHRVAELRRDERVHHDRRAPSRLLDGDVQILDVLDARVPDLLERLVGELRLEREHEPLRRLSRRVRDDVELDRDAIAVVVTHGRRLAPAPSYDHRAVRTKEAKWHLQS